MDLGRGDEVISMSVLDHVELDDRGARRVSAGQRRPPPPAGRERRSRGRERASSSCSSPERLRRARGQASSCCSSITVNGFGKRTSAYEYRVTNRGGQGIINIETSAAQWPGRGHVPGGRDRPGDAGHRPGPDHPHPGRTTSGSPGRNTQGVKLFHTGADEHIVSAARSAEAARTRRTTRTAWRSEAAATCPIACHCRRA